MKDDPINHYRKYRSLSIILSMLTAISINTPAFADNECGHKQGNKANATEFFETNEPVLHDQLKLAGIQETAWHNFITKMKMGEHPEKQEKSEQSKLTTPDRLDHRLAIMRTKLKNMEFRAQAMNEFYDQLTSGQQQVFDEFFRSFRDRHKQS
ncbi:MAG: Spy/CpxP family protein refolding chaperone [Sulfuriferula sp.]